MGELMVFAHAVCIAEQGDDVAVLIDDGPGAKRAVPEIRRLQMLASRGQSVGRIKLISTVGVLERAIDGMRSLAVIIKADRSVSTPHSSNPVSRLLVLMLGLTRSIRFGYSK